MPSTGTRLGKRGPSHEGRCHRCRNGQQGTMGDLTMGSWWGKKSPRCRKISRTLWYKKPWKSTILNR